ncbi:acetyltransferase family protein, partial [Vibrio cholerae HC-37A1]
VSAVVFEFSGNALPAP